jgi:serine protease Do
MNLHTQRRTCAPRATLLVVACLTLAAPHPSDADESLRRTPVVEAVERTKPAVVNVYTETVVETRSHFRSPFGRDPLLEHFFGDVPRQQRRTSLGTGVVVRPDGIVVTNEHVIVQATSIRVLFEDNREFEAELLGSDSDSDLAVLRIRSDEPLPYVPIGADDSILIGETVIAIGNPFGLSHTVTTGVVSAVGRSLEAGDLILHDFLQTDASINPGNSGGPLLDVTGRLIGINSAIRRDAEGIGFAIPVWKVRRVVEQLLDFGSVRPAWVGLLGQDLTPDLAFHFGVAPGSGVLVRGVEEGSPAEDAGVRTGDILVRIGHQRIHDVGELGHHLRGLVPGAKISLTLRRDDREREAALEVANLPQELIDGFAWAGLGVEVAEDARADGVVVRRVRGGSPAERIGMETGDVIVEIGGGRTTTMDTFRKALAGFRDRNNLLVSVLRGRRVYRVTVALERSDQRP